MLTIAGTLSGQAQTSQPPPPVQLPLVLFVHGRGQKNRPDDEIRVEWLTGFREGQRRIGALGLIPTSAIAFTFYQHAYESAPQPPTTDSAECSTLVAKAEESEARLLPRDDSIAKATAVGLAHKSFENAAAQAARDALSIVSPDFLVEAFTGAIGRDTYHWLNRHRAYNRTRCILNLAFAHAGTRPIIVVAHSMGTLAVYDYLVNKHPGDATPNIVRFITLGSQLGNPGIIARLDTSRHVLPYHYPPHVHSWVNLHDYEDFITYPFEWQGRPIFEPGGDSNLPPLEFGINDPSSYHHQIGAYLAHPFTARAIASAWCESVRLTAALAQDGCATARVRDVILERDEPWRQSVPKRMEHVAKFALLSGTGAFIMFQAADHNNWPRATLGWFGAFMGATYAWIRDSDVR